MPKLPHPTTPPAAAAPAANANRPAAAEYQRLLEEWKTVLKDLRKLKVQYQSAALADQANIQTEWNDLVEKGNETVAALEAAGVKAYAEAPNEDPQLTRFLVKLADDAIQRDDYAAAKRITDVLIEHQCSGQADLRFGGDRRLCAERLRHRPKNISNRRRTLSVLSTYGKELEPTLKEYKDLWAKEKAIREAEAKADDLPRVKMTTTKGVIVLELFENEAPETVGNFVSLVEKRLLRRPDVPSRAQELHGPGRRPEGRRLRRPGLPHLLRMLQARLSPAFPRAA